MVDLFAQFLTDLASLLVGRLDEPSARGSELFDTPPGVGLGMKPPLYLKKGDVMTLGIEGLGEQRQDVVPFKL